MGQFYNVPPPQPAVVHVPPNAAAQTNVPPNPIGSGAAFDAIRSSWLPEDWAAQSGDIVAAQFATPFVPPVAIAASNPAVLVAIRTAWPLEQWGAQRAAQIASLFATATNPPVAYPSEPAALALIRGLWPQESWYAQSEAAIAAGIAQVQLPPIYIPWSTTSRTAVLRSLWLSEDWPAQTAARGAGWIAQQQPVAPLPTVIRHLEIALWTPDTWPAQGGTRAASIFAGVPSPTPYVNRWLAAALRSTWLPESWPAQTFPDIAAGESQLTPPPPRAPSQFTISLWPAEFWGPQAGTRDAAILATPQLLVFMPWVVGLLQNIAVAELQSLFQAVITIEYVYSGAPPQTVVYQSVPRDTLVSAGTPVTLQVSLGIQRGPIPFPIVESILVSNIPIIVSIQPPDTTVIQ